MPKAQVYDIRATAPREDAATLDQDVTLERSLSAADQQQQQKGALGATGTRPTVIGVTREIGGEQETTSFGEQLDDGEQLEHDNVTRLVMTLFCAVLLFGFLLYWGMTSH
jgi:hypothetical protein